MRRPITSLPALAASIALALPPLSLPASAQGGDDMSRLQFCQQQTGATAGQPVVDCLGQIFAQLGMSRSDAGERARRLSAMAARAAPEAVVAMTLDEIRDICRADVGKPGGPDVLSCVAAKMEAQGDTAEADRARAAIPAAAEREAVAERRAADEAKAASDAQAASEAQAARQAQAARDAQAAAAARAAVLSLDQVRDLCRAEIGKPGGPDVLSCVAARMEAQGDTAEADRARAAIPAAAEREAAAERRAAAAANDTAGNGSDRIPESRIAAEVAARAAPVLSAQQQQAARQAANALSAGATGGSAAAAGAGAGTVSEQVVTDADVRSSSQDFDTGVVVTEDEGGLSTAGKFALGALGVLAVGTILNNRNRVVSNSGDRVVVQQEDGALTVLKDDDALLRQAGSNVRTESFDDGSTRTVVTREDGSQIITIRDASLRVLRRVLVQTDGAEFTLIDDTVETAPVDVSTLSVAPVASARTGADPLRDALRREAGLDRRFSLSQVRNIAEVRALAPAFDVSEVTFASGSAAITPEQAGNLTSLAREVLASIQANPREMFLIEGHTDAVGDGAYNLALSDRRAETLALALNEYFGVPVENMVVQGYGERFLKIDTQTDERANRRAAVRQITQLLQTAAAN